MKSEATHRAEPAHHAVTAESLRAAVDRLLAAQRRLAERPLDDVLAALDGIVARWLHPSSPWRLDAEALLPLATGFSPEMIRHGLPLLLEPLRGDAIGRLLDEEIGDRRRLDAPSKEHPRLIVHVLPGNLPALAASAVCLSLAVRSAVLVKPGTGDRCFPQLFADSIAAADPDLGACVAACYWPGGDTAMEHAAFERADVVDAAGGDAAMEALRGRARRRFVGRGDRISFAVIGREIAADPAARSAAARALAEDVSVWDQLGCLSPQVVFVEANTPGELDPIVDDLAQALEAAAHRLPPRRLAIEEQAAVLRFRQDAEWNFLAAGGGRLVSRPSSCWAVLVEEAPALRPTGLHRTVRLQPIRGTGALAAVLAPMRRWLEAAGVAAAPARFDAVSSTLRAAGVHRICAAGQMQRPDLTWKPGGIPRVAPWLA